MCVPHRENQKGGHGPSSPHPPCKESQKGSLLTDLSYRTFVHLEGRTRRGWDKTSLATLAHSSCGMELLELILARVLNTKSVQFHYGFYNITSAV